MLWQTSYERYGNGKIRSHEYTDVKKISDNKGKVKWINICINDRVLRSGGCVTFRQWWWFNQNCHGVFMLRGEDASGPDNQGKGKILLCSYLLMVEAHEPRQMKFKGDQWNLKKPCCFHSERVLVNYQRGWSYSDRVWAHEWLFPGQRWEVSRWVSFWRQKQDYTTFLICGSKLRVEYFTNVSGSRLHFRGRGRSEWNWCGLTKTFHSSSNHTLMNNYYIL